MNNRKEYIGATIAHLRTLNGMTQQQLADAAKVNRVSIARLEKGIYNASIDVLERILNVLDAELTIKKSKATE